MNFSTYLKVINPLTMSDTSYDIASIENHATGLDYIKLAKQMEIVTALSKTLPEKSEKRQALEGLLAVIEEFKNAVVADDLVPEEYVNPEKGMSIVAWPLSQSLMEHPEFDQCVLINDDFGFEKYGSAAYWVPDTLKLA
jgi:hypothetical protein